MKQPVRMLLCVLLCLALLPCWIPSAEAAFRDVPASSWAADAISRAVSAGLIQGRSANTFGMGDPMTRGAFVTVLCRFFGWKSVTPVSATFEDAGSSAYLFIADAAGDMQLAVSDMEICARLTPDALKPRLDALNGMDAVILDANLSEETLCWLAPRLTVPVIADAVSTAKAGRLRNALPWLRVLKPNAIEAEALTGVAVADDESAWQAMRALVDAGVERVFITLGERGVCCGDALQGLVLPGPSVKLVNATGAGDAFTAALAWAELRGLDLRQSAMAGLAAAAIAVEAMQTVSPDMSEAALTRRMAQLAGPA